MKHTIYKGYIIEPIFKHFHGKQDFSFVLVDDVKCDFCGGVGEVSRDHDGMAVEHECSFCDGLGIDKDALAANIGQLAPKTTIAHVKAIIDEKIEQESQIETAII